MKNSFLVFIIGKSVRMLTLLVALCFLTFMLLSYSPIDPIQAYVGADAILVSPEQREKIAEYWGLNEPPMERFFHWGAAILQGDFGMSMTYRRPVSEVLGERFSASIALMLIAWLFSGVVGFTLGVLSAMKRGTWIDRLIKWYCLTLASTPVFWLGLLLLLVFSVGLGWFPIGLGVPAGVLARDVTFFDQLRHLFLPALTLSIVGVSNIALHTREKLMDVLESDYILYARAKGERGFQLFWRHGLRNVSLPAITLQFTSFSELFGGSILAEQVFSYPGLGEATIQAGLRGDMPLLLGAVLISALFVFYGNLIADIIYRVVDPRTKEARAVE